MKRTTLIQLWKLNKVTKTPFLGNQSFISTLPFMKEYLNNYKMIDRDFIATRGCFAPTWNRQYEDSDSEVLTQFKDDVDDLLFRNKDNYQHIYDVLLKDYDPIENYNRYEDWADNTIAKNKTTNDIGSITERYNYGQIKHNDVIGQTTQTDNHGEQNITDIHGAIKHTDILGESKVTNQIGSISMTDEHGAIKQVDNHGARTQTDIHGSHTDTSIYGSQTNVNAHQISGYNGGLVDDSKDTISNGSKTDTLTSGSYTDNTSMTAYTDTLNKDKVIDKSTTASHTDVETNGEHTNTHTEQSFTDNSRTDKFTDTSVISEHNNTHTEDARSDSHSTDARTDVTNNEGSNDLIHKGNIHGNIGVTTTQQMIESEIKLRLENNLYKIIYEDIIKELCVLIDDGVNAFSAGFYDIDEGDNDMTIGNDDIRATVIQTDDGAIITITDKTGTSSAKINNGITPKIKVEADGDMYVNYDGKDE